MFFILILLLGLNVKATYHLTIVLVTAPKKVPMLTYTIEYIIHAYEYSKDYDSKSLHGLSQRKADGSPGLGGYDAKRLYGYSRFGCGAALYWNCQ